MGKTKEDLRKEMDELDTPSKSPIQEGIETKPPEEKKEEGKQPSLEVELGSEGAVTAVKKEEAAPPKKDWEKEYQFLKADFEKEREHRGNLDKARREDRERIRNLNSELALERAKKAATPAPSTGEDGTDPEVQRTIEGIVNPKIGELEVSMRQTRYQLSEQTARQKYGEAKVEEAIKEFQTLINPQSEQYDAEIQEQFMKSLNPLEYIMRTVRSMNLDKVLDTQKSEFDKKLEEVKKQTAEETRKQIIDELTKKGMSILPSLSQINGGAANIQSQTALRKELDEL